MQDYVGKLIGLYSMVVSANIYRYNLLVCLLSCCHGLSGHFRIQRLVTRTSLAIRTGCQDHRVHSRVIRTKKTAVRTFFFVSAQKTQNKPTHLQGFANMFLYRFDYTLKLNVTYNDSNIKISFITLIPITIYWMMMIIKIIRLIIIDIVCFL